MSFFGNRVELQTSCNIFTNDTQVKKTVIATCVKEKMAASDRDAEHRSAIQVRFPSGLTLIDTLSQLKTKITLQYCLKSTCI